MFTPALRVLLVVAAIGLLAFLLHSIRKSKMDIADAMFWTVFALIIVIMSVFPQLPSAISDLIGFQSPVNFVFLLFLLILIVRDFMLNRRISQLENRVKELAQQISIDRRSHYERRHMSDDANNE